MKIASCAASELHFTHLLKTGQWHLPSRAVRAKDESIHDTELVLLKCVLAPGASFFFFNSWFCPHLQKLKDVPGQLESVTQYFSLVGTVNSVEWKEASCHILPYNWAVAVSLY